MRQTEFHGGPTTLSTLGHRWCAQSFRGRTAPWFRPRDIGNYEVVWSANHREWLGELTEFYELVWATTWEHSANESMAPILGLPELPVIEFERGSGDTWKLESVRSFVTDRPFAWIDDDLFLDAFSWARNRDAPTLLLRTSSSVGMTLEHHEALLAFGKGLLGPD